MIQLTKFMFHLELKATNALCLQTSGVGTQPCIPNGGSPFRFYDYPRITDVIFTGPETALWCTCRLASEKPRCTIVRLWRRVDYLSSKDSSKGYSATPLTSLFYSCKQSIRSKLQALSVFQTFSSLFASRSRSVRYV